MFHPFLKEYKLGNNIFCCVKSTRHRNTFQLLNMYTSRRLYSKFYILLGGLVFILIIYNFIRNGSSLRAITSFHPTWDNFSFHTTLPSVFTKEGATRLRLNAAIVIGAVVCSQDGNAVPREEALVMIKSVLISAQLYNVSWVKFHLFLEHKKDSYYFVGNIMEWGPFRNLRVDLHVHSAISAVPEKYHSKMAYDHDFRCGYVRIFFPSELPDVDSIIYLDTDMIVTGSILDVWTNFDEMSGEQLIGVARNNEASNPHWMNVYKEWFGDIPHPRPKGLNSGLLLMNLTRMRDYNWQEKILRLFDDYSRIFWINDQRLINTLLYFDQGILKIVPCKFNFRNTHCERGLYCDDAEKDPKGIQIIHGAANHFQNGKTLRQIFLAYQKFKFQSSNFTSKIVTEDMMIPIKKAFSEHSSHRLNIGSQFNVTYSKCFGILDKLLFKNYI